MTIHKELSHGNSIFFQDRLYQFQALRTLSGTPSGYADIAECLMAIKNITENDDEAWFSSWNALSRQVELQAQEYERNGHFLSASSSYSRASNYYRTCEFFLHTNPGDKRIYDNWKKSRDCFIKGMKYFSHPITQVTIPFESSHLPGYLCLSDSGNSQRPLLIVQTGFDGTQEELYFSIAKGALQRGYHCLLFEGPGQGGPLREQGLLFRYNWETVITPVIDFALDLPQIQKDQIALMGISMGGYLVPRALCFEKRVKLAIADGGLYDFHALCMKNTPPGTESLLDLSFACNQIDKTIEAMAKENSTIRWAIYHGMYAFGAKSPSEWLRMTRPYSLKDVVKNITCPMLVVDSDQDFQMGEQSKQLYNKLDCKKEYMLFTGSEGAGAHCQIGALSLANERIFNWLDSNI